MSLRRAGRPARRPLRPLRPRRAGSSAAALGAAALLVPAALAAGTGAARVGGDATTIGQLLLTSVGGSEIDEPLSSFTLGAAAGSAHPVTASALTPVSSVSAGELLARTLSGTRYASVVATLPHLDGGVSYRFERASISAYLLAAAGGTASVSISLSAAAVVQLTPSTATTTSSLPPPPAAKQTCVADPQKASAGQPAPSFPRAAWEVPTAGTIRQSSPTLATIGAGKTIAVFADEDGYLYVVDAATCQLLPGWPRRLAVPPGQLLPHLAPAEHHAVVESTPAVAWLNGPSAPPDIVVGAGSTWQNTGVGEVEAFDLEGHELWDFPVHGSPKNANGVFSSPAIGPVVPGTGTDVVFGSWDYELYVLDAAGKMVASYHNAETIWSSPALYRLPGHQLDDIYIGLDKTQTDVAGGCVGGIFADLRWGSPGSASVAGAAARRVASSSPGLVVVHESGCQGALPGQRRGQAIWSSPAIGLLDGQLVAAIGTSFYDQPYGPGTDRLYLYPADPPSPAVAIRPLWTAATSGPVLGSPAIGVVGYSPSGASETAVVDTSFVCPPTGQTQRSCQSYGRVPGESAGGGVSAVQAFVPSGAADGASLRPLWTRPLPGGDALTSPVLVPLRGERSNDVLVGSPSGLYPLAGSSGAFLYGSGTNPPQLSIHSSCVLFNSPAVADVAGPGPYSGWYAYELCSYPNSPGGGLFAFPLPEAPGGVPAWPMFRGDPSHSGISWSSLGKPSPLGDPTG